MPRSRALARLRVPVAQSDSAVLARSLACSQRRPRGPRGYLRCALAVVQSFGRTFGTRTDAPGILLGGAGCFGDPDRAPGCGMTWTGTTLGPQFPSTAPSGLPPDDGGLAQLCPTVPGYSTIHVDLRAGRPGSCPTVPGNRAVHGPGRTPATRLPDPPIRSPPDRGSGRAPAPPTLPDNRAVQTVRGVARARGPWAILES
jgi:hypothetical protein